MFLGYTAVAESAESVTPLDAYRFAAGESPGQFYSGGPRHLLSETEGRVFIGDTAVGLEISVVRAQDGETLRWDHVGPDGNVQQSWTLTYNATTDCWVSNALIQQTNYCGNANSPYRMTTGWIAWRNISRTDPPGDWLLKFYNNDGLLLTVSYKMIVRTLKMHAGNGQTGLINTTLPTALAVELRSTEKALSGVAITFTVTSTPGAGAGLSSQYPSQGGTTYVATTNAEGIAVAYLRLSDKRGSHIVTASAAETDVDLGSPQTFTLYAEDSPDKLPPGGDPKNFGEPEGVGGGCVGNPINHAIGNKYQVETDATLDSRVGSLVFRRFYNSMATNTGPFGNNWTSTYHRHIVVAHVQGRPTAFVHHADGKILTFALMSGVWRASGDIRQTLEEITTAAGLRTGWRYRHRDGTDDYDAAGKLIKLTDPRQHTQTLTYTATGDLSQVESSLGVSLSFTSSGGLIRTMTDHTGRVWDYEYDSTNRLVAVTHPDDTQRRYHYENSSEPHLLTGISDANNVRYATFRYDKGRATGSSHIGDANGVEIEYRPDGTRLVKTKRGQETRYATTVQQGAALITAIDGPSCAGVAGVSSFQYDPNTNALLAKTVNGLTTQYGGYDSRGNLGFMIEAAGTALAQRTEYTYDPRFWDQVASQSEPSVCAGQSQVTRYEYDARGEPVSTTIEGFTPDCQAVTRTTRFTYTGPQHQVSAIDGPRTDVADVTTFDYYPNTADQGANRGRLRRVTTAEGQVVRDAIQYTATGKVASELQPNGLRIDNTYQSGNDRLLTITESAGGQQRRTRFTYLPSGEIATITQADGGPEATTMTYQYDAARRVIGVRDGAGNTIQYMLDSEGNRVEEKIIDPSGQLRQLIKRNFDIYNRPDTVSQGAMLEDFDYPPDGNLLAHKTGRNILTRYGYDVLKRQTTRIQDVGGSTAATANTTTHYAHDVAGRITRVTAPNGAITTYQYDDLGNRLRETSDDTGVTTSTYDAAGNVRTRTDARNQTLHYTYDALDRLLLTDAPGTADDLAYTYDQCLNGTGRLCRLILNGHATDYTYDPFGNIRGHQGVSYAYDALNRVTRITYPSGNQLGYIYDAAGRVTQVEGLIQGAPLALASQIRTAPQGPLTAVTYGNGLTLSQRLDESYLVTAYTLPGVRSWEASYDKDGNLEKRVDKLGGPESAFRYDALARLDVATGPFGQRDYDYDPNGNRQRLLTEAGTQVSTYAPASNRLTNTGGTPVETDATGNTITQGPWRFEYNSHNRLRTVHEGAILRAQYAYNGLGQRREKSTAGLTTRYVYDQDGKLLAEVNAAGAVLTEYVYLEGAPLAMVTNGQLSYIHPDHLGTPERLTDASGRVVWAANYDPFGRAAVQTDPDGNGQTITLNLRFPGQYFDQETGLHYNYFRDYDPAMGRYIESDPIGLDGGLNTYLYANGNPMSFVDPTGENAILGRIAKLIAEAYAKIKRCMGSPVCKCKAIHYAYKAIEQFGCNGQSCLEVSAQAVGRSAVVGLRSQYIRSGCDTAVKTEADHPGALQQAILNEKTCLDKVAKLCGNCVP